MLKLLRVKGLILLLAVSCGSDDEKAPSSEDTQAATCSNACVKISACVGQPQAQCEEKCGIFTQAQLQCAAGTTTCPAAEACLAQASNNTSNNNSTTNNTPGGDCSGPLGACQANEICVRKSSVYTCVQTNLDSCNDAAFPDICDCLYSSTGGVPPEAEVLCSSQGITSCSIRNNRLSVDCR